MKRIAIIILLLTIGVFGQFIVRINRPISTPLLADSAIAALGGLRTMATEAIWFYAERLQENGRYVELSQMATTLTILEPHTPEVWSYAAWNLAYNVSIMMPTAEDRWRWVLSAIRLLRDEGVRLNPKEADLYRELAWLFQLKLGADLDTASSFYRSKWAEIVNDVSMRNAWQELKMEPKKMREIEKLYSITDWTNPQASALYWANEGLKFANKQNEVFLKQLIKNSSGILMKKL